MKIVRTADELVGTLEARPGHISIDGATGVGKSTAAAEVAKRLGMVSIQLDGFLPNKPRTAAGSGQTYVDRLDLERIRAAVDAELKANRQVIVDGICVRAVLARIGLTVNSHVYVKAVDSDGFWGDETICDVDRIKEAEEYGIVENLSRLDAEIRAYHREYDPAGTPDVLYVRTRAMRKRGSQ